MLPEDLDEVERVEAQQQDQLVLTLSVVTGSLWGRERGQGSSGRLRGQQQVGLDSTLTLDTETLSADGSLRP